MNRFRIPARDLLYMFTNKDAKFFLTVTQMRIGLFFGILRQHVLQRDERIKRGCEFILHMQEGILIFTYKPYFKTLIYSDADFDYFCSIPPSVDKSGGSFLLGHGNGDRIHLHGKMLFDLRKLLRSPPSCQHVRVEGIRDCAFESSADDVRR